ncbi:MAG: type II secretion system protein [Armatimonadetes bacterium]|nr:type II secretion system protein [Armatimonadota bacterium]
MVRKRGGFSLVELLTVIGIIVVLAAILLPVLGRAREQTRRTQCMSNLHQIATALKLYKLDERAYPFDLSETSANPGANQRLLIAGERWFGPVDPQTGRPTTGPGYGLATLFPDYVQSISTFNCPNNEATTLDTDDPDYRQVRDTYQSYDGWDPLLLQLKYCRLWRPTPSGQQDPDFTRQLYWRYPPEDTVVTWCAHHRRDALGAQFQSGDQDIVLYLDGSTQIVPTMVGDPRLGSGHLSTPGEE